MEFSKSEIRAVFGELATWRARKSKAVYDAAELVMWSLEYCRRNGTGKNLLLADVELLRQVKRDSDRDVQTPATIRKGE